MGIATAMAGATAGAMRLPMAEGIGASNGQAKPLPRVLYVQTVVATESVSFIHQTEPRART